MTYGANLRGLSFTQPALNLGVADLGPDRRYALAVLIGSGSDRFNDDELIYDLSGVDLSAVRDGRAPLLFEHRQWLDAILGAVADAWLEDGVLKAVLRFAQGGDADRVWSLVSQGFPVNLSIGSQALETVDVGPSPHGGRRYQVTSWRLVECSVVARGQRPEAHVVRVDQEHVRRLVERMPAAEDAARLAVRRRLQLDRWDRWAMTAGIRLAQELAVDVDRLGDALSREVAGHGEAMVAELAVPVLADAGDRAA